ncbi:Stc1 domain-containing protein [Trichoderma barbatum]
MASKKANANFNLATKPSIPTRYKRLSLLVLRIAHLVSITRFRCKVGGEWKPLDEFSKNQQRFIQTNLAGRCRIDAANSNMTCREHSSGQRTEMTCELCGLVKPLSEFSGSTKRSGNIHCKRCTAWMETQEPEVVPAPLETGHISIEEERGEAWPARFVDSTDFFTDDVYPQAPITGLSSLGLEDGEVASILDASAHHGTPSEHAASEASSSRALPPHLRGSVAEERFSLTRSTDGPSASSRSSFVQNLPPHLRPLMQQALPLDAPSDYTVNSELGDNPSSISTATTAREARLAAKPRRVSFNAWDPNGVPHRGFKSVTDSSAMETSDAGVEEDGPPNQAGQARGKWAKNVRMTQTELRQVGTNHHVAAREVGPVKHRPVHHDTTKCCEPDDDDGDEF